MNAEKEAGNLLHAMLALSTLIENAETRREADAVFQAIVIETDTVIASFIWDYYVDWEEIKWSGDKDRTG